ncbi:MAG: hypothetical protein KA533_02830 [Sphingobium sp.]|nr:hypothetical protein [Sphingobium sp.]
MSGIMKPGTMAAIAAHALAIIKAYPVCLIHSRCQSDRQRTVAKQAEGAINRDYA